MIENIARQMDEQPRNIHITITEAIQSLSQYAIKDNLNSPLRHNLQFKESLVNFLNKSITLETLREHAEKLSNNADEILGLICAITNINIEPILSESILFETIDRNAPYKLMDAIHGWVRGLVAEGKLINESVRYAELCQNIHANIVLLETNVGNHFKPNIPNKVLPNQVLSAFDKLFLEIVSTGGIAIRPTALGNDMKQPRDIFPRKKKKHWYQRYAIER